MASGWSSTAKWAAGPQSSTSSAATLAAHQATMSGPIISVSPVPWNVSNSFGTSALAASHRS